MARKTRQLFKQTNSNNWNCRPQWRNDNGTKGSKQISLGTSDKQVAWQRYSEVESKIQDLKDGLSFVWSWQRDSQFTKVKVKTVQDAFDNYIKSQEANGLKPETILGTKDAYRRMVLSKCVSPNLPVKSLKDIVLEDFKVYWTGNHSPNTINQGLNKFKAFLNYCVSKKWMTKYETFSSTLQAKPVSYFTDDEFKALMGALETGELKRAILFYRETGCRKSEPFIAKRVGNTLIIPKMKKNKVERRVQLTDILCHIHDEMMARFNERKEIVKSNKANWDWWYLGLKKACKQIGLDQKTLHDLRDTYVVRLWAKTGDIHLVKEEIGHSDIKQTVEYAQFTSNELLVHFPSLKKYLEPRLKVAISVMERTELERTFGNILKVTDGGGLS
jgi:integrase